MKRLPGRATAPRSTSTGLEARFIVYALVDPRSRLVHYIGRCERGSPRPLAHGAAPPGFDRSARARWIRKLRAKKLRPLVRILDARHSFGGIRRAESDWIRRGRQLGWPLTNVLVSPRHGNVPGKIAACRDERAYLREIRAGRVDRSQSYAFPPKPGSLFLKYKHLTHPESSSPTRG